MNRILNEVEARLARFLGLQRGNKVRLYFDTIFVEIERDELLRPLLNRTEVGCVEGLTIDQKLLRKMMIQVQVNAR